MQRRSFLVVLVLLTLGAVAYWAVRHRARPERAATPRASAVPVAPTNPSRLAELAAQIGPDATSPIAAALHAPAGDPRRDVEVLAQVLEAWQTNFPGQGNPVGDNAEITLALAGDNRLRYAFIAPKHPAINANGELCDRWGTPFRFHALSGTQMDIISAGPDRRFATEDDVQFAPGRNSP